MQETSLVAASYRFHDRVLGVLGIVGPRRMPYAKIVPLVEYTARLVSRRLTRLGSVSPLRVDAWPTIAGRGRATTPGGSGRPRPTRRARGEETLDALRSERDARAREAAEAQERYLRTLADFENFRRRTGREREDWRRQAQEELSGRSCRCSTTSTGRWPRRRPGTPTGPSARVSS